MPLEHFTYQIATFWDKENWCFYTKNFKQNILNQVNLILSCKNNIMARWTSYNTNLNFVNARLEWLLASDKEWPHFKIVSWNKDEWEKVICESCTFIEWKLINLEVVEAEWEWKKTNKVVFTLTDDEWNQIKWRIGYWTTVRKVIQKLSAATEIGKVKFNVGRFSMEIEWGKTREWNYVAVFVDEKKMDDPFDYEKDIKPKRRVINDPETWEFVKFVDTELEKWVLEELVPSVASKLKASPNFAASEKDIDMDDDDNLPF